MRHLKLIFTVLLAVALMAPVAAAQGRSKAKKKKSGSSSGGSALSVSFSFGSGGARTVREFFGNPSNTAGLPPGLAKREELPPGLQRHLQKNGVLPPGLQKKLQPLPTSLTSRLPKPPKGVEFQFLAGNVLAVEVSTHKVLDIVADITIKF